MRLAVLPQLRPRSRLRQREHHHECDNDNTTRMAATTPTTAEHLGIDAEFLQRLVWTCSTSERSGTSCGILSLSLSIRLQLTLSSRIRLYPCLDLARPQDIAVHRSRDDPDAAGRSSCNERAASCGLQSRCASLTLCCARTPRCGVSATPVSGTLAWWWWLAVVVEHGAHFGALLERLSEGERSSDNDDAPLPNSLARLARLGGTRQKLPSPHHVIVTKPAQLCG